MNRARWNIYLGLQEGSVDEHAADAEEWINLFKKHCPPDKYPSVLDAGAGAGVTTRLLKASGYMPIGITLGVNNLLIAKEKHGLELLEQDYHHMGFPNESFHAIFTLQSAEHALSPTIMFMEFYRVLKVGGIWFLDTCEPADEAPWVPVWHGNLHSRMEWVKYAEMFGFHLLADESTKHRIDLFLMKLPHSQHPNWKQLAPIYEQLTKLTNDDDKN